ncbi:hypothetical protein DPMN_173213 [Dreissena polymorpha]|uniref:Uncharacterized protein n=1 Tax=Dreissena polymorpha TaxID=45954 RepID=A0A9D4E485_DREPO|nr:hypothetical protein DPMN_173213 [Dreissena polymorpha]
MAFGLVFIDVPRAAPSCQKLIQAIFSKRRQSIFPFGVSTTIISMCSANHLLSTLKDGTESESKAFLP